MSESNYIITSGEELNSRPVRWRPEDMLLTWLAPMDWKEIAADTDERALEAYRAIELTVRLRDAFEAPKLRELLPRLGEETIMKLLAYAWVQYESRRGNELESTWQLLQHAQFLMDTYPLESIKDIIYAFRRTSTSHNTPREIMTEYLEWKSQKLEEWHRSFTHSSGSMPAWILEHCPPHWIDNKSNNETTENRSNTSSDTDQAA